MKKISICTLALMLFFNSMAQAQNFITRWTFSSAATSITFNALAENASVNYTWSAVPSGASGTGSFASTTAGSITLSGLSVEAGDVVTLHMEPDNLRRFYIQAGTDKDRLTDVTQWGAVPWTSMADAFSGCTNLNITATDIPNLSTVTSMAAMFLSCYSLTGPANIGSWNTSSITNMTNTFRAASLFNQPIGNWKTSSLTSSIGMFFSANAFNQNIGNWQMGSVTNAQQMFQNAVSFNQNLGNWQLNPAVNMFNMLNFCGMSCTNYSATLNGWYANNPTVTGRNMNSTNNMQYGTNAVAARTALTTTQGWVINSDAPSGADCGAFITKWTFGSAATSIKFNALTENAPVNYTWSASPSGNSGSGAFTSASPAAVTLSGLNISAGDVVTLAMEPFNLRRFYMSPGTLNSTELTDVAQWGGCHGRVWPTLLILVEI